jgi:hypothetical protein
MKRLADLAGRELRWAKSNGYELRDGDDVVATLRFRSKNNSWTGGGTLEFAGGRRLTADTNCWQTKFAFSTEAGEPLVRFTKIFGLLKLSSKVEILPAGATVAGAPWLVMLGWYLSVQMHNDAASSASAASVAT